MYWLGGGSGAGKSTIARRLAAEQRMDVYSTDDAMAAHAARCAPASCPLLETFKQMDMDERWLTRKPEVMLETFHWYRGEGFDLIVEDLLKLPPDRRVIVEGFRLLPHLVKPLLKRTNQAVWLIPSADFRLAAFESRGGLWTIAGRTSDPARALQNLLARDHMFTARTEQEVKELGLASINLDVGASEDEVTHRVADQFGLLK